MAKGTNENSNELLREFYPEEMDLSKVSKDGLHNNLELMKNRPRKGIKYKPPKEELFGFLLSVLHLIGQFVNKKRPVISHL
ncbi:hypothetical protein [Facklamia sp. P13055]|uniref:hypothetical protein n=1 Tax=Facklamia sp. P13055 TaxID=3421952 RepID=UPI003D16D697